MRKNAKEEIERELTLEYNQLFNRDYKKDLLPRRDKEEMFLYNYFNHKLRCGDKFSDKDKKLFLYLTNKFHTRYGDNFGLVELKEISTQHSLKYPERKYNQLIISHTLKEKKYSLIPFISSFISAYDVIVFYRDSIVQNISLPIIQKLTSNLVKRIYILEKVLEDSQVLYHACFMHYHQFLDGDNTDKLKAYTQIEMLVDEYENHKLIKEVINLSNALSYVALKNYAPVEVGEVGASPQEIQLRESHLTEEEDVESEEGVEEEVEEKGNLDQSELEKESDEDDIEPI